MTFILTDENDQKLSDSLSSFWFYLPFTIQAVSRKVQLLQALVPGAPGCRVAVLIDGAPSRQLPPPAEEGLAAGHHKLTLKHAAYGTLMLNNLQYEGSVHVVRNNEWAEIRLFHGVNNVDGAAGAERENWIKTQGWEREQPVNDQNPRNFWRRTFKFAGIDGAALDATTIETNEHGSPTAVTLIRPLINSAICEEILAVGGFSAFDGNIMPGLTVTTSDGPRGLGDVKLFGNVGAGADGYVMIAAGAFAAISADSMLSAFESISSSADAMRRLAQVAWAPDNVGQDGRLLRKLNNIHDTSRSGVFEGSGLNTDPVEVLYVRAKGGGNLN